MTIAQRDGAPRPTGRRYAPIPSITCTSVTPAGDRGRPQRAMLGKLMQHERAHDQDRQRNHHRADDVRHHGHGAVAERRAQGDLRQHQRGQSESPAIRSEGVP